MMSKHTPGPWELHVTGLDDFAIKSSDGQVVIRHDWAGMVAPRAREDWSLIAAAPDLLEALKAVMDEWRDGYGLNCVEQVRAAIAKAEGRA